MKFSKFSALYREILFPAGLMAALIMGAGIFSLPYLFAAAGFWTGVSYLVIFGISASLIHLMYSEIIKRTPGDHRFVGYAKVRLGNWASILSFFTTLLGIILVLLIYLVLSVKFGKIIFSDINSNYIFLAAWAIFSLSVISGVERLAKLDMAITVLKLLIVICIFAYGVFNFDAGNFPFEFSGLILPYSAVLFSLSGRSAISSIHQYLKKNNVSEKHLGKALVLGTLTPAILYALFVIGVLGISGDLVTEDAISGIAAVFPLGGVVIAVFGLLSLWTAYTFLGFEAHNILISDFKLKTLVSSIAIAATPLILYFAGFDNFLWLIGISGGVLLALESILVILMWQKVVKPKPFFYALSLAMIAIFVVAGASELISLLK